VLDTADIYEYSVTFNSSNNMFPIVDHYWQLLGLRFATVLALFESTLGYILTVLLAYLTRLNLPHMQCALLIIIGFATIKHSSCFHYH
jgi:hypothetical protein